MKNRAHKPAQRIDESIIGRKAQINQFILDNVHDLVAIHKLADLSYEYVNSATLKVLGYTQAELFKQSVLELVHPEDMSRVIQRLKESVPRGDGQDEFRYRKKDGSYVWLEVTGTIISSENEYASLILISRDVTARKQAETALQRQAASQASVLMELNHVNRALGVIRAVTGAAIQAANEEALLHNVCQHIVEVGGYSLAWVGYLQADQQQKVKPVAYAGSNSAYLAKLSIALQDPTRGYGPTGNAIRTGKPVVSQDFKKDASFKPWLKDALRRGFKSSISIPLLIEDKPWGALIAYSSELDRFDSEEEKLLMEIADIMTYAISCLRARTNI